MEWRHGKRNDPSTVAASGSQISSHENELLDDRPVRSPPCCDRWLLHLAKFLRRRVPAPCSGSHAQLLQHFIAGRAANSIWF